MCLSSNLTSPRCSMFLALAEITRARIGFPRHQLRSAEIRSQHLARVHSAYPLLPTSAPATPTFLRVSSHPRQLNGQMDVCYPFLRPYRCFWCPGPAYITLPPCPFRRCCCSEPVPPHYGRVLRYTREADVPWSTSQTFAARLK